MTDPSMVKMELEAKKQYEANGGCWNITKSCCFATCCPGVLTYNLCVIKGYPTVAATCCGCCAFWGCLFSEAPIGLCCFLALPPKNYPKAYKLSAPPKPLKRNPKFIKGKTTEKQNEKALLRHYKSRFGGTAKKFKGLDVDKLSKGFAKGVSMANAVAPDSVAKIEMYVHDALPGICQGEDFKNGITALREITSSFKEKDKKEKQNMQISAGVILGKIVLNIIKVAIPGAGPILAIIGKALELAADPAKREKIRKNPGTEIAKLVITMAFQAFIPIPGADSVLDELLEKVFETAGAKLEGYIHNQLDKRVANGSNSTKTADFKKSADELRATLGVSGGAELNAHAKEQLKKLGTGVIELIKQQLMEALSLHGVDFLELIPCLPLPCCAPSADAMDRGQDGGEGSMPDDTGFFSGEPPFQVNTETITAAVKEISQLKKAIVANDVIADIQKAIIAGSEDNSSAFNFDNSSAELTTETKKKLDMLAGLIKEKVEGDGNVVLQLEGRSPEALALAEQRAQAAHAYLMTKGVSAKHLGHVGVVDASFTPSLVLTAGQPFDEGEGGDVEFRNPSYSH